MIRWTRWIISIGLALAAGALNAASSDAIQVRLAALSPLVQGDGAVQVSLVVTNSGRDVANLLRWQLPADEVEAPLFRVTRDGEPVLYIGPLAKRAAPQGADFVRIAPGTGRRYVVDLSAAYDLTSDGIYTIEYLARGGHGPNAEMLRSNSISIELEGRTAPPPAPPDLAAAAASVTFTGKCTAAQKSTLATTLSDATNYAKNAALALGSNTASLRYTTWFGAYTANRFNTVKTNFTAIRSAFETKPITLDCKCRNPNTYAYVYASQPYKIYLCGAFWSAPMTGFESRAGTLIHEMSHFNVVAGTDDWVYGATGSQGLAVSDPAKAIDNADSYECFAENDPALP